MNDVHVAFSKSIPLTNTYYHVKPPTIAGRQKEPGDRLTFTFCYEITLDPTCNKYSDLIG